MHVKVKKERSWRASPARKMREPALFALMLLAEMESVPPTAL
jgi:hypothetical protein